MTHTFEANHQNWHYDTWPWKRLPPASSAAGLLCPILGPVRTHTGKERPNHSPLLLCGSLPSYMRPTEAFLRRRICVENNATIQSPQHTKARQAKHSQVQNQLSRLERLPEEVTLQILGFLDYIDIVRVRRASRSLSCTTRLRILWIIFIQNHGLGPMVQRRFDVQTSAELESVVARKARADHTWMHDNAVHVPRHTPELIHDITGKYGGDYFLAPGGRWAFHREDTRIIYADLELPARGWRTLIQRDDNVVNTLVSYELTQESAYFSLRLAACGFRKRAADTARSESESETWCSVHSVSVILDEDGDIDGLQAALLSVFTLGGRQKINAINVYQDRMAIALAETGVHRIIDWRAADGCKDTFPEIRLGGMPVPATIVLLLPNHFYFSHTYAGDSPAGVYDLSSLSLSPTSDDQIHFIQPVTEIQGSLLAPLGTFIPFVHDDFSSILIGSSMIIFKLSIPLASHAERKPILSRAVLTPWCTIILGCAKFFTLQNGKVGRSTMQHLSPHPTYSKLNRARYVGSSWPPRPVLCVCCSHYDHLTNRIMSIYSDGEVRITDLVL